MSTAQASSDLQNQITPPPSFVDLRLTPQPTDEKSHAQAAQVLSLFHEIQAGKHNNKQNSWPSFSLTPREFEDMERRLKQDESLFGYVKDKVRYEYDATTHQLVIRRPTSLHKIFIAGVEDAIHSQLKAVRRGSGKAALFAQKVFLARSSEIYFPVNNDLPDTKSKYEPDASFWHSDARYPGVIIEVASSQQLKRLDRLAEDYLLDSDTSVQVVVGLDIGYSRQNSHKATLSVWRTEVFHTSNSNELRVVQVIKEEAFRDDQGNAIESQGLRLRLSDFACEELTREWRSNEDIEVALSGQELNRYLAAAKEQCEGQKSLIKHTILPGIRKRKVSELLSEVTASEDERDMHG